MLRLAVPSRREKRTILNFLRILKPQKGESVPTDTTDYLMSSPVNKELLLKAIDDYENNRDVFIQRDLIEI
jgi:hypothetical protein